MNESSGTHNHRSRTSILEENGLSLRILDEEASLFESSGSGMMPLFEAIHTLGRTRLRGSVVVDKIVGKAAALLIAFFRPREVHCRTISRRAEIVLTIYGVPYHTDKIVSEICRPGSNDLCPFEEAVIDVDTPLEGYRHLTMRMLQISQRVQLK